MSATSQLIARRSSSLPVSSCPVSSRHAPQQAARREEVPHGRDGQRVGPHHQVIDAALALRGVHRGLADVQARVPELPDAKQQRLMAELGLNAYDAAQIVAEKSIADFYESALSTGADAKSTANWITGSLFAVMNANEISREDIDHIQITPQQFGALVRLVEDGTLNKGTATSVLDDMWATGADPAAIVAEKGLAQVSDSGVIKTTIQEVLAQNDAMVQRYLGGEEKLFGALMGQAMKALKGQGNPQVVKEALQKVLAEKS
jgi:aspartyl-tRNA(Asn)/glutamyl-tRNA(Gln) amidotransferase subunit B